jgi:DNA-binding PadR family transcriptional regulator
LESDDEILRRMHRRMVRFFLDVLVLSELRNRSLSGYDIISFVHQRFGVLLSPGTAYSCLNFLEREGLIESKWARKKRVYKLTVKGEQTVEALLRMKDRILGLVVNLFLGE